MVEKRRGSAENVQVPSAPVGLRERPPPALSVDAFFDAAPCNWTLSPARPFQGRVFRVRFKILGVGLVARILRTRRPHSSPRHDALRSTDVLHSTDRAHRGRRLASPTGQLALSGGARQRPQATQQAGSRQRGGCGVLVYTQEGGAVPGISQTPHGSVGSFLVGYVKVMGGPSRNHYSLVSTPSSKP